MTISRKRRKEYIKAGASFCINCGNHNISAGRIESETLEAWQHVVCFDCGSKWNDIFRLIGVGEITLPEDGSMAPSSAKSFKTQRKWRNAALTLEKGARLFQYCLKLLVAARIVIRNWERGDLAAAVRNLEVVVREIERFLRTFTLRSRFASSRRMSKNLKK
jgi:hypothetical protein